ncbi:MAG TPA: glycoside hydrolase family 16 protein [Micromonosporaceae bacterium]|nr:glycoside hydrolase family 16 protein [Micromonosporaceae bacterium]
MSGRASVANGIYRSGQGADEPAAQPVQHKSGKGWVGTTATIVVALVLVLAAAKIILGGGGRPTASPTIATGATSARPSTPAVADPSGVPMPVGDLPGWHQTFADDFSGTQVDPDKWYVYDGQPLSDPAALFVSSHVSEGNGVLTIGAWPTQTPKGEIFASGGINNSKSFSQTYGRYDVRFRMEHGWGIAYAILLWPTNEQSKPEIDFAEDNGKDRTMTSATTHPIGPGEKHVEVTGDFTQWHTAEVVWSPGKIVYRLDGKVWATMTGQAVPAGAPVSLALQTQSHPCGGDWEACPNSSTPSKVNLEVDWVTAYAATSSK